jgi:hydrogenase maturation protease
MIKPILIFGYGNLSRGDDALGPLLLDYIESHCDLTEIELLTDFQLQIEHALDLEHRSLVLFVDASVACINSFDFSQLSAARDKSYTTHAMSPAAVLAVYVSIKKQTPPPSFLMSIKAESMELGEGLSCAAENNFQQACLVIKELLRQPNLNHWLQQTEQALR